MFIWVLENDGEYPEIAWRHLPTDFPRGKYAAGTPVTCYGNVITMSDREEAENYLPKDCRVEEVDSIEGMQVDSKTWRDCHVYGLTGGAVLDHLPMNSIRLCFAWAANPDRIPLVEFGTAATWVQADREAGRKPAYL